MEEKGKRTRKPKEHKSRILFEGYYMEHDAVMTSRFNLYRLPTATCKTDVCMGYGLTVPTAIEMITYDMMDRKQRDFTLKKYLSEFRGLIRDVRMAVDPSNLA